MATSLTAVGVTFPDSTVQTTAAFSAGGTLKAVASGSLSDGSTVVVNADGTVSAVSSINLTSENFIGISDGAYTNGQTATILIAGSVSEVQTGLTAGQAYYVLPDGTLSQTPGTPSVFAGTAIAATKLLVQG